jgi:23S rRNA U2552 (ribose-2'-O)-methylase RlmE/FtsJ
MNDGFLHRYFLGNGGKRLHKWLHYFDIYERHLERFRGKSPVMIEIGVAGGGSLAMWKEYFGPGSEIIGVDIKPNCKEHEAEGIEVFIGSQDDPSLWDIILEKYPDVDIVLDDGSHVMKHMIATFEQLYHRVNANGIYMVEDTHTCYWSKYDGGYKKSDSFMEFAKEKIDELNAFHMKKSEVRISDFTRSTDYIAFYDSIVVFEKKPQGSRQSPITIGMPETRPEA